MQRCKVNGGWIQNRSNFVQSVQLKPLNLNRETNQVRHVADASSRPKSRTNMTFSLKTLRLAGLLAMLPLLPAGAGSAVLAQEPDFQQPMTGPQGMSSADRVEITPELSVNKVTPGSDFKAALVLDIDEGWHINAHRPTLDYLIGTEFEVDRHEHFIMSDDQYPEPEAYEFAFAGGEELLVYQGETPVIIQFRASSQLQPGEHEITGRMTVQACDDQTCLAPTNIDVTIPVEVTNEESVVEQRNEQLFAGFQEGSFDGGGITPGAVGQGEASAGQIARLFDDHGTLLAFGMIFLFGLALNLTPCVYPMLSVTVSLFGATTEKRTGVVFSKAVLYVLGIATMYSLLGVAAALSGGLFGAWLQSPMVLATIGVLFFLLALSMFGYYELQMPYWLTSRLGSGQSTGFVGTYFSGLVVGIFAAPCIGPPIIALLAFVGTQGDPVFGFQAFFILALGLGLPYLILGTFTGLMSKLPKSGMWMVWVKKVFGVLLIGLGLFYVGLALYPDYVLYVIPLTALIGGVYLGFIEASGMDNRWFHWLKRGVGTASLVFGLAFALNMHGDSIEWQSYSEELVSEAREQNQAVVMDFYADWCIPCLELEQVTFSNSQVINETEDMKRLKVDLTQFDSEEAEALRERYNVAGVPTIVFLGPDGEEVREARVVGYVGPDEFMNRLDMVNSRPAGAGGNDN